MKVVAGSYHGGLYGWEGRALEGDSGALDTRLAFKYGAHIGCVKAVAICAAGKRAGKLLVSGGTDERVRLYDLEDQVELGDLQQHTGAVTCLAFVGSSHLLSGSADSTICIWRVHDWTCLHILGEHGAEVTSIAPHPSGRLALSVARDKTLRLWDLIKGRCAFTRRLGGEAQRVCWSPDGSHYGILMDSAVQVHRVSDNGTTCRFEGSTRVNAIAFLDGASLVAVGDDRVVRVIAVDGGSLREELDLSKICGTRIRSMDVADAPDGRRVAVLATTGGQVLVWDLLKLLASGGRDDAVGDCLLGAADAGEDPRLTCLSAAWDKPPGSAAAAPHSPANAGASKVRSRRKDDGTGRRGGGRRGLPGARASGTEKGEAESGGGGKGREGRERPPEQRKKKRARRGAR